MAGCVAMVARGDSGAAELPLRLSPQPPAAPIPGGARAPRLQTHYGVTGFPRRRTCSGYRPSPWNRKTKSRKSWSQLRSLDGYCGRGRHC